MAVGKQGFYNSQRWHKIRMKVRQRDGHRCVRCGVECREKGSYAVDHIKRRRDYPDLAYEMSNLELLCSHHHNSVKKKAENSIDRGAGMDDQGKINGFSFE
jgi:uncharacterized protein (TIGR02646 family)